MPDLFSALSGAAASGVLQRTFLLESSTFNFIPRILCVFDVIEEESPEFHSNITEHPVEDGPEITDHIQPSNPTLSLKGWMSNSPLDLSVTITNIAAGALAAVTSSQFRSNVLNTGLQSAAGVASAALQGGGASAAGNAILGANDAISRSILLDAWQRKARFDVVTKRQRYTQMVIEKLAFPRSKDTGFGLYFELNLKQIRVVKPFQVNIASVAENVVDSATSSNDLGAQSSSGVTEQTQNAFGKSWLKQIVNGVRGK